MTISKIDLICFGIIIIFGFRGYKKGAIGALLRLVGLIASFALAWYAAPFITEKLMGIPLIQKLIMKVFGLFNLSSGTLMSASSKIMEMAAIVLMFILVNVILNKVSDRIFGLTALKVVSVLDRILGLLLGVAMSLIVLAIIAGVVFYAAKYTGKTEISALLSESYILSLFSYIVT